MPQLNALNTRCNGEINSKRVVFHPLLFTTESGKPCSRSDRTIKQPVRGRVRFKGNTLFYIYSKKKPLVV
ncbi:hypothetical protein SynPROS71_01158 [Synechococcus sp. PROS-7-1]|nr:hypothetical protein SynBMKMC1_01275 [Synechococcus sp. BMK-MC-1]QNI84964.1 hypothetical protein SynPROS71_01158 [Synechococcus sp. PROS-7-1]